MVLFYAEMTQHPVLATVGARGEGEDPVVMLGIAFGKDIIIHPGEPPVRGYVKTKMIDDRLFRQNVELFVILIVEGRLGSLDLHQIRLGLLKLRFQRHFLGFRRIDARAQIDNFRVEIGDPGCRGKLDLRRLFPELLLAIIERLQIRAPLGHLVAKPLVFLDGIDSGRDLIESEPVGVRPDFGRFKIGIGLIGELE